MKLDMLLDCSVIMLDLLIRCYKAGQLTYEEFIGNTELKVTYIKENITCSKLPKQTEYIKLLMEEHEKILSMNSPSLHFCDK